MWIRGVAVELHDLAISESSHVVAMNNVMTFIVYSGRDEIKDGAAKLHEEMRAVT